MAKRRIRVLSEQEPRVAREPLPGVWPRRGTDFLRGVAGCSVSKQGDDDMAGGQRVETRRLGPQRGSQDAQRKSQVDEELMLFEAAVGGIRVQAERLESRLGRVLAPAEPGTPGESAKEPATVELASQIRLMRYHLEGSLHLLQELARRVEL